MAEKQWVPLESNPDVVTRFSHALGLSPLLKFSDVWSLDLLDMVPSPRYAVILLFPCTDKLRSTDAPPAPAPPANGTGPYFCQQRIGNACGTIALLHAALNTHEPAAPLEKGSFLARFAAESAGMTPGQRADALVSDDGLDAVHSEFARQGQTAAPAPGENVDTHFVCFVDCDRRLYELDGRKDAPVDHGACAEGRLLETAAGVIREEFMNKDPTEHRFTILALTMAVE